MVFNSNIKGDYKINKENLPFILLLVISFVLSVLCSLIFPQQVRWIVWVILFPTFYEILKKIKYFQKTPKVNPTTKARNYFHIFLYIIVLGMIIGIPFYGVWIQDLLFNIIK